MIKFALLEQSEQMNPMGQRGGYIVVHRGRPVGASTRTRISLVVAGLPGAPVQADLFMEDL